MAKGRRTKAEEEYMINHRDENMSQIAKDLGRTYEFVRKFISSLPPVTRKERSTHIITETPSGRKGVAIMTKTASERIDSRRKKHKKKIGPSNGIRKIKDE